MCACVHVCARFDFRCRACLVILSLPGADGGDGCFCNCLSCAVCCRRASPTQPGEEEQVLSVAKKSFGVGAPLGIDTTSSPHTTRYKSNAQSKTHTRQTKQVHFPHSNPPAYAAANLSPFAWWKWRRMARRRQWTCEKSSRTTSPGAPAP